MLDLYEDGGDPCPECEGTGSVGQLCGEDVIAAPCMGCGGSGRVTLLQADGDRRDLRLFPEPEYDERDVRGSETISPNEAAA